jgi:hypothetical protein
MGCNKSLPLLTAAWLFGTNQLYWRIWESWLATTPAITRHLRMGDREFSEQNVVLENNQETRRPLERATSALATGNVMHFTQCSCPEDYPNSSLIRYRPQMPLTNQNMPHAIPIKANFTLPNSTQPNPNCRFPN